MTENDTQALFAVARKCPSEISQTEVLDFIQTIPSLPLKPWFKRFNLNSIIMTTTLTIAISTLLLFSNQQNSTSEKNLDSRNNSESFISVDSSQNQTNSLFHQNLQEAQLDSVKEIQGTKSESKAQNQSIETSKISTVDDLNNEQSIKPTHITLTTVLDSLHKLNIQIPTLTVDELKSTNASNQKDQGSIKNYNPFTTRTLNPKIHKRDTINIDELPSIQTKLLDQLALDRYINSKSEDITLEFSSNGLKVNAKRISKENLSTYVKLLNEHEVELRSERKIFLNNRFIILADRNNGVFRCWAFGEKLKFTFSDNKWESLEENLFRDNALSK
ncbi:MAG: hypothetical protein COW03_16385 [Cytophagales bacterium CG12_big_fil_rev_8_21_14_0_65_40_12]|nr:MAG: hypothetical protein COW03_16385 [Cytophagales bacterium CG12_big_fil_rev_8_21_14_0_65_40_12]PIW05335.1 MAG: hypothetical protein COW40_05345 [Cytophagales bacterium CG17_big_fil_post_rev_8_21_14_2_50_40_13]